MIIERHTTWIQLLLVASLLLGVCIPTTTNAFFWDRETASVQQFKASELVLELITTPIEVGINAADAPTLFIVDVKTTLLSIPSQYDVVVESVSGEAAWCDSLNLEAVAPSTNQYLAPASSFMTSPEAKQGNWEFQATSINTAVPLGTECTLALHIEAWQLELQKGGGYTDSTTLTVVITRTETPLETLSKSLTLGISTIQSDESLPATKEEVVSNPAPESTTPVKDGSAKVGEGESGEQLNNPTEESVDTEEQKVPEDKVNQSETLQDPDIELVRQENPDNTTKEESLDMTVKEAENAPETDGTNTETSGEVAPTRQSDEEVVEPEPVAEEFNEPDDTFSSDEETDSSTPENTAPDAKSGEETDIVIETDS